MDKKQQREFENLKQEILASVGASGFADQLQIDSVKLNENGSVAFSFVAENFKNEDEKIG